MDEKTDHIKILFLKKKGNMFGVASYQNNLLHLLNNSKNFELFVLDEHPKIKNKILNRAYQFIQSLRVIRVLFNYLYLTLKAIKYRKNADYLLIAHPFKYGLFAILISFLFKIPFLVSILGWTEKELKLRGVSKAELFIRLKYEYWVLKKARYVLSSHDLTKSYSKIIKNRSKFLNIDSPIDTNRFKPAPQSGVIKNKLELDNKRVILTSASLDGIKGEGVKILLKSFVFIKNKCDNIILLIAGDGGQRKDFESQVKNLNLEDHVVFLGYYDNMPELINLSDIFILIFPFGGGIGAAVKEAMACEKPCVISKTTGTEILDNGKGALLVDCDPRDIADKTLLILNDEKLARELGINARKKIETEFSIEKAEEKLATLLGGDIKC